VVVRTTRGGWMAVVMLVVMLVVVKVMAVKVVVVVKVVVKVVKVAVVVVVAAAAAAAVEVWAAAPLAVCVRTRAPPDTLLFVVVVVVVIRIPTDCPQRERRGWMGDAQASSDEAMLNFRMDAFYASFLQDIRDDQLRRNGNVPLDTGAHTHARQVLDEEETRGVASLPCAHARTASAR
jgi:hypothetical protein